MHDTTEKGDNADNQVNNATAMELAKFPQCCTMIPVPAHNIQDLGQLHYSDVY